MNKNEIRALFVEHGGRFYGPRVEHANIEEQAFYRFVKDVFEVGRNHGRGDTIADESVIESVVWGGSDPRYNPYE